MEPRAMKPEETASAKSPLDKPLGELTEEDIAQVTREDCRRFLKKKGMRRPSWNKSQAIQQVICLKALLEPRLDSSDDLPSPGVAPELKALDRPPPPSISLLPPPPPRPPWKGYGDVDVLIPPPGNGSVPNVQLLAAGAGDLPYRIQASGGQLLHPGNTCVSPRATAPDAPAGGQMTIFYGGKVNVYDGVPPDKARAIMLVAASPNHSGDALPVPGPPNRPLPSHFATGSLGCVRPGLVSGTPPAPMVYRTIPRTGKLPQYFRERTEEWKISREIEPEGPVSRKASLQRYREKRKDRGRLKCKRNVVGSSSSPNMGMYLSQNGGVHIHNDQLHQNGTGSSTTQHPRAPSTPIRCSSVKNQAQRPPIFVDLNDDDLQGEA